MPKSANNIRVGNLSYAERQQYRGWQPLLRRVFGLQAAPKRRNVLSKRKKETAKVKRSSCLNLGFRLATAPCVKMVYVYSQTEVSLLLLIHRQRVHWNFYILFTPKLVRTSVKRNHKRFRSIFYRHICRRLTHINQSLMPFRCVDAL